jgi:hypothetical protein
MSGDREDSVASKYITFEDFRHHKYSSTENFSPERMLKQWHALLSSRFVQKVILERSPGNVRVKVAGCLFGEFGLYAEDDMLPLSQHRFVDLESLPSVVL